MPPQMLPSCDIQAVSSELADRFRATYGREPSGCFLAPGRVNLIGEHVDYNDGRCLPIALPQASYVAAAGRSDDTLAVTSLQQQAPWAGRLAEVGPGRVDGWPAYVAGVAWALREEGIPVPGADLLVDSRVPLGAGLSSSAALECSVALALCALAGAEPDEPLRRRLAAACVRAETEVAGAPTGGMDQTVSLLARRGHALLIDCQDGTTRQVPWGSSEMRVLVVDTRVSHQLTDGGYGDRRSACTEAARRLGVRSLREIYDSRSGRTDVERLADPVLRRRVRHVISEMARVDLAVSQIEARDWAGLGRTFTASHASLRDDYEVSCAELDAAVDAAVEAGALGARMTGGGFGGAAIALVPADRLDAVVATVTAVFDQRRWRAPRFLEAVASDGARALPMQP